MMASLKTQNDEFVAARLRGSSVLVKMASLEVRRIWSEIVSLDWHARLIAGAAVKPCFMRYSIPSIHPNESSTYVSFD